MTLTSDLHASSPGVLGLHVRGTTPVYVVLGKEPWAVNVGQAVYRLSDVPSYQTSHGLFLVLYACQHITSPISALRFGTAAVGFYR